MWFPGVLFQIVKAHPEPSVLPQARSPEVPGWQDIAHSIESETQPCYGISSHGLCNGGTPVIFAGNELTWATRVLECSSASTNHDGDGIA